MHFILICLLLPGRIAMAQPADGWNVFAEVKFNVKFFKEWNESFLVPHFDNQIKALEGKEITLRGHNMPMDLEDSNTIIISKYPYAQCFFCGGAGPESVAEIVLLSKRPKLKADQIVTVTGRLQLNATDVNHLNFILNDASLIK